MSSGEQAGGAVASALAAEAYALVPTHPRHALELAERAREAARAEHDVRAEVAALHAAGWARVLLDDPGVVATLRAAIRVGRRGGDSHGVALVRRLLATQLAWDGQTRAARREIEAAVESLDGDERARSQVHRLEIYRLSRVVDPETHRRVCADAARALRRLHRNGDELWEARLLFNRGLLFAERGELDDADADFRRAETLYRRSGAELAAVDAAVQIAELERRRGEVLACLRTLDAVQPTLRPGYVSQNLVFCRASVLTQARLLPEAAAAAETVLDLCVRSGRRAGVGTALLDLSAIALLARDAVTAHRLASKALRSFAAQRKPVDAALARGACLRAQLLRGSVRRSSVRSGLAAAAALELAGWRREALRTRLLVARVALALGSRTAMRQLELARPLGRSGTVADRIELCHARALLRLGEGDHAGAERLLAGGLELLDGYRAALGAADLRATASGLGDELSQTGLRIAIEMHAPAKALLWTERLRANALLLPPVRPPADPEIRTLQAELRRVSTQLRQAKESGISAPPAAARQARLEASIRTRMRLIDGERAARTTVPRRAEAARTLGDRVLVEYVALDGALGALTLAGGQLAFHELGADTTAAELEWLRFALGRLARGGGAIAQRAAAHDNAVASAAALDRLLLEPLLPVLGNAPAVIVPTGALHALPWGALPSMRGRPTVVAPSLSLWSQLERLPRSRRRRVAFVAGPRLRHSASEIRTLAPLFRRPTVLSGHAATAHATLAALDGAALAHLACHGRFRADSPLFSSLELADGPLNVYELQSLKRAPDVVVLSACDLALSDRHPGDELLGLAAALLGLGTRTIVASVVPVPDAAAKRVMLSFHRNLAAGDAPAAALAKAQARADVPGFVCLGSG